MSLGSHLQYSQKYVYLFYTICKRRRKMTVPHWWPTLLGPSYLNLFPQDLFLVKDLSYGLNQNFNHNFMFRGWGYPCNFKTLRIVSCDNTQTQESVSRAPICFPHGFDSTGGLFFQKLGTIIRELLSCHISIYFDTD